MTDRQSSRGTPFATRHRYAAALAAMIAMGGLAGCGSTSVFDGHYGEMSASTDKDHYYIQRLVALRKSHGSNPSADSINALRRAEEEAATHYLASGNALMEEGRHSEALEKFELGLVADPRNKALHEARLSVVNAQESERLYAQGMRAKAVGNFDQAEVLLQKASYLGGDSGLIQAAMTDVSRARQSIDTRYVIRAFDSPKAIELNFRDARLKDAVQAISAAHGLNFVFDEDIEDVEVSVSAANVTFAQAFEMLMQASGGFYKVIGPNALVVSSDTAENRKRYEDRFTKTFHVNTMKAEKMAELVTASVPLDSIVANAQLNTIQVRDTRETLEVIERLIAVNDRSPAEIMLDVEILEINRGKSEQLGLDFGSQVAMSMPQFSVANIADRALVGATFGNGLITLPTLTFKYFKNDVDARTLAKPRIRTVEGNVAKIHIGDRVPLRSSTVQDSTGQTRTQFEYRDVGIRLEVLPEYFLDGTVSVDMTLEVSSLGQNLGTPNEPAYSIGTRNVETVMQLRQGETAVLGGLIREEDRRNWKKVPGLGDAPSILGRLFTVNDDAESRTDLLLTITPHVLRDQGLPAGGDIDFYSGTGDGVTTRDRNQVWRKATTPGGGPRFDLSPRREPLREASDKGRRSTNPLVQRVSQRAEGQASSGGDASVGLAFAEPLFTVDEGKDVTVEIVGRNLAQASNVNARVLFDPTKVSFVSASPASTGVGTVEASAGPAGTLDLTVKDIPSSAAGGEVVLATLTVRGDSGGLAYLLLNERDGTMGAGGAPIALELGASKIKVK